ncbi:Insulin receptor substrate 2-B [Halotydeus destructor]|nr:Insulin receptor substrate 2-B [Halotydeus destructor]
MSKQVGSVAVSSDASSRKMIENNETQVSVSPRTVLKQGYAKKLKTMKSRYFVLWKDSLTGDVKLEYFDSQKKYQASVNNNKASQSLSSSLINKKKNNTNKRQPIIIKECFSINKRVTNVKNSHAIAIYTAEDCFSMLFDDEKEFSEWLDTLVQQKAKSNLGHNDRATSNQQLFEHVWQVEVTKKGLVTQHPHLVGRHRLCLSSTALFLFRASEIKPSEILSPNKLEFPLNAIRKCGHSDSYFSIELGRSSSLGSGDLLMQVEDGTIAHHMHKTIHEAMKSSTTRDDGAPVGRPRSASTSESAKNLSTRRSTIGPLNVSHSHFSSLNATTSTALVSAHSAAAQAYSSLRDRSYSMHERTRTISEGAPGHYYSDITGTHTDKPGHYIACMPSRTLSYSPPVNNPMSPSSAASCTDSVGSSHSINDCADGYVMTDAMNFRGELGSMVLTQPPIAEEGACDDYYMGPVYSSRTSSVGSTGAQHYHHHSRHHHRTALHLSLPHSSASQLQSQRSIGYSPVSSPLQMLTSITAVNTLHNKTPQPQTETDGYITMSPGSLENGSSCSRRSSSFMEKSFTIDEPDSYMEMRPDGGISSLMERSLTLDETDGYMEMKADAGDYMEMKPDTGYVDMKPGSELTKSVMSSLDEGYLDMMPMSSTLSQKSHISSSSPRDSSHLYNDLHHQPSMKFKEEFPLDKVRSYFSPSEEESSDIIKPARAYSIGSRPQMSMTNRLSSRKPPNILNSSSSNNAPYTYAAPLNSNFAEPFDTRVRAYSMGSHMPSIRERIRANRGKQLPVESVLGTIKQLEDKMKNEEKCSSVPSLNPFEGAHRARSSTCGSRIALLPESRSRTHSTCSRRSKPDDDVDSDLMVIDYTMSGKNKKELKEEDETEEQSPIIRQQLQSLNPPEKSVTAAPTLPTKIAVASNAGEDKGTVASDHEKENIDTENAEVVPLLTEPLEYAVIDFRP